jgi:hypothetical protein
MKSNNTTKPYKRPVNLRRKAALERAEAMLQTYTKAGDKPNGVKRLQYEIAILKTRIIS